MKILTEHRVVDDIHIVTPKVVQSASDVSNRKAMAILERVRFFDPNTWKIIDMYMPIEYYMIGELSGDNVIVDEGRTSTPVRANTPPANKKPPATPRHGAPSPFNQQGRRQLIPNPTRDRNPLVH